MTQLEELRDRLQRMDTLLSTVSECFKVIDADCRLIDMNEAGLALIEADSLESVLGVSVLELLVPGDREAFCEGIRRALFGERVTQEFEIIGLRGTRRWMQQVAVAMPPKGGVGLPTQVAAFTRDITPMRDAMRELDEAKRAAEMANRAKTEFLANVSHEIRTPLNAIVGYIDLLGCGSDGPSVQGDSINTIRASADHLLSIVDDLLDLSKLEFREVSLESAVIDPEALARGVLDLFRPQCDAAGLSLVLEADDELPSLLSGDPLRLRQVLMNLVSNAVKFTSSGSVTVRLGYESRSGVLRMEVEDTGVGMTDEQLELIREFRPFCQADASTTRRFGGTGMGLAIVHQLTRLMDGTLSVESTLGEGSGFVAEVVAPEASARDHVCAAAREPAARAASGRTLDAVHVLAVDDYRANLVLIERMLTQAGARVSVANDGRSAVSWMEAHRDRDPAHVVLMDIQMPGMDGCEAARAIRQLGVRTPILALTANALDCERARALDAGCDAFLTKPIVREVVIEACAQWASRSNGQGGEAAA